MINNDQTAIAVLTTTLIVSLFWGLIWSAATISRLKNDVSKKDIND